MDTAKLKEIFESVAPPGMQVVYNEDRLAFYGVNPDKRQKPFSTGHFGAGPQKAGFIELVIRSWRQLGEDEVIRQFEASPAPGRLRTYYLGMRAFTLSVRVECDKMGDSFLVSEEVINKLYWESTRAKLEEIGLSVIDVGAANPVNVNWDNRVISASVVDLDMQWRSCVEDTTAGQGWIQTVGEPNITPPTPGIKYALENEKEQDITGAIKIDGTGY